MVEAALVGLAGLVLLLWPDTTLSVLSVLTGILMLVMGLVSAWVGRRLHGAERAAS